MRSGRSPILAPALLALVACAVLLVAVIAEETGHLVVVAAVLGGVVGLLAAGLLYRQTAAREAASGELRSAQAWVGGIIESAMDPIITVDDDQRIVAFNPAAEAVFKWARAAVIGQPLDMLVPERLREAHRAHIRRFGEAGVTSRRMGGGALLTALRADGREFPIEASISKHSEGTKSYYTVILRDATHRVEAETLLARSEARLRGILESAMDAIITVDDNQRVVIFNRAAEEIFGWPQAQALGMPLDRFIPERFRGVHASHVRDFGETGATPRRMGGLRVVTGVRRDGTEFPIDASISRIVEDGRRFYSVILRDITERVQAETELHRWQQELHEMAIAAHSAREQEKSRMARELHDELGQDLTALRMDVAWLKDRIPPGEQSLVNKVKSMESVLEATVAATRRISADLRPLVLDDLGLVAAVEWLARNFTQRTGVHCELAITDPELQLGEPHATTVFRVLQESLTNAAKHAQASWVEVNIERTENAIALHVRDDGRGFDTNQPRKPDSYGLMGLRQRALLLGGDAKISSKPGEGTSIEVLIPLTSETP